MNSVLKIGKKKHRHISDRERRSLWVQQKYKQETIAELAERLERHVSTLYRELARNGVSASKKTCKQYNDETAHRTYEKRWRQSHMRTRIPNPELRSYIVEKITKDHYTPKQIAGFLRRIGSAMHISHTTIYNWIYHERPDLKKYLSYKGKKRKRNAKTAAFRTHIPHRVPIHLRGEREIMNAPLHFEVDLVGASSRQTVLCISEKLSRYAFYHVIENKKAETVMFGVLFALREIPSSLIRSFTYDNGKENVLHEEINRRLGSNSYFCDPYASWQKGQVEYAIRLFRQYFPKRTDFSIITSSQVARVQQLINNRPRQCLGFLSPSQLFHKLLL